MTPLYDMLFIERGGKMFKEMKEIFYTTYRLLSERSKLDKGTDSPVKMGELKEAGKYVEKTVELRTYLNALTHEQVKTIQTVMYVGREFREDEGKSPMEKYQLMKEETTEGLTQLEDIQIILDKAIAATYLLDGIKILNIPS